MTQLEFIHLSATGVVDTPKPLEIIIICWFGAQETFLIISVEKNPQLCYLIYFVETMIHFFTEQIESKKINKKTAFKRANVFTVTTDRFNASLLEVLIS